MDIDMCKMKLYKSVLVVSFLVCAYPLHAITPDGFCEASDTAATPGVLKADGGYYCLVEPDVVIFKIHEIGVCTSAATPADRSSCTAVFTSAAGTSANLTGGSSIPLDAGISLSEGTYSHGYILVDNTYSMRFSHTFSTDRTNSTGMQDKPGGGQQGIRGTSGPTCFTNANAVGARTSVSCGANASAAGLSTNTEYFLGNTAPFSSDTKTFSVGGQPGALTSVWVLNSDQTQAGIDYLLDNGGQPNGWISGSTDRKYIFAVQSLASPMIISPDTVSINVTFNVTNSTAFDFLDPNDSGCPGCVSAVNFEGMKFNFSSQ